MDDISPLHLVALAAVAFLATFALVPLSIQAAYKLGAIDLPSSRRIHTHPMPRLGGLALFGGLLFALIFELAGETLLGWSGLLSNSDQLSISYSGVIVGLSVMVLVGAIDDVHQLSPSLKLAGQIVAAVIIVMAGVQLGQIKNPIGDGFIEIGWLDYPLTVFYLVSFANIINLIDGMDGLATGITAISAAAMLVLALTRGRLEATLLAVILLSVCLAFLRYNFPPARTFMGDSGALFLGVLLGVVSLTGVMRSPTFIILLVPLVIAGVPIIDTLLAIIRRISRGQPIHLGDTDHLHHLLLRKGISPRAAVLLVYAWTALLAVGAVLITGAPFLAVVFIFIFLATVSIFILWRIGLFDMALRHFYQHRSEAGDSKSAKNGRAKHTSTDADADSGTNSSGTNSSGNEQ